MRILYCNKYNFRFSGTESYLFETMELMRARGHEVALFSMADARGAPTAYDRHFVEPVNFREARGVAAKARLAARATYSTEARRKIRAMIADFRPDVAHVRNIYHHLTPSILWELKAQGVPVVYHMNDMKLLCPTYNMVGASGSICDKCKRGGFWHVIAEGCYRPGRGAAAALAAEAYVHRWLGTYKRCVDIILVPSEFVRRQLTENGWANCDIRVLPHFQQMPLTAAPHPRSAAPILYFGRLSPEKGVADLIAAMSHIRDLQLTVAGDGPQRAELEKLASTLELENIRFTGHLSGRPLDELIAQCQFTVFPSRAYETLGKSILESFAHARAVVASDLGSRRELVHDGATGILYPAGDIRQLAAAVRQLHHRPELARAMGEAAHAFVAEEHSVERHLSALTEIYEALKSRPRNLAKSGPLPLASEKLKVAYIGGRGVIGKYSGIETYYEETGQRLTAKDHEITVYCRRYFTPSLPAHNGMRLVRLPTIRSKHLETFVHTALSTAHACLSSCQIVHYQTLGPALFSFVPRLFGKKTVVTVQGLDWQRGKWSWFARCVLKCGEWAAVRFPNKTVVVSKTLREYFRSKYKCAAIYVPNGASRQTPQRSHLAGSLGLVLGKYVLFLGRFSPEKNCELLIDAFEAAAANISPDIKLVLAGGPSHTEEYARCILQRATDRILILEWLTGDTLQQVLSNAALFVLPSDLEGMSLSLLEAMGAGVCVLTSNTPENCEVVSDCGFTFQAGDVRDLRQMLEFLLAHEDLRWTAADKARRRVDQNYLWDQVTAKVESLYRELAPRRSIAPSSRELIPLASANAAAQTALELSHSRRGFRAEFRGRD